jgi:hypothetical protein
MFILSCPTNSIANCKICTYSAVNFLLTYVNPSLYISSVEAWLMSVYIRVLIWRNVIHLFVFNFIKINCSSGLKSLTHSHFCMLHFRLNRWTFISYRSAGTWDAIRAVHTTCSSYSTVEKKVFNYLFLGAMLQAVKISLQCWLTVKWHNKYILFVHCLDLGSVAMSQSA